MVALTLRLMGTPPERIAADYHLSEALACTEAGRAHFAHVPELVRGVTMRLVTRLAQVHGWRRWRGWQDVDVWCRAPPLVILETLQYIDTTWGSVQQFCSTIGFWEKWQQRLVDGLAGVSEDPPAAPL